MLDMVKKTIVKSTKQRVSFLRGNKSEL